MDAIIAVISALQAQVVALQAIQSSVQTFSQADIDKAVAAAQASFVADLQTFSLTDAASLSALVAKYSPAPASPPAAPSA